MASLLQCSTNKKKSQCNSESNQVLDFWFGANSDPDYLEIRPIWFNSNESYDESIRTAFSALYQRAVRRELESWRNTPHGALALVLVLDQFPRNMFRGTPRMYASDKYAMEVASAALLRQTENILTPVQRIFLFIPYMHSENPQDQERGMELYATLQNDSRVGRSYDFMRRHRDVIARFGRFPHRNKILSRESSAEELAFLEQSGGVI